MLAGHEGHSTTIDIRAISGGMDTFEIFLWNCVLVQTVLEETFLSGIGLVIISPIAFFVVVTWKLVSKVCHFDICSYKFEAVTGY